MDDDTIEFPAITGDDDGPECGTAAAMTWLLVTYATTAGGIRFTDERACCYRHVPRPDALLPPDADLIEVVIEDAFTRTRVFDGVAEITVHGERPVQVAL